MRAHSVRCGEPHVVDLEHLSLSASKQSALTNDQAARRRCVSLPSSGARHDSKGVSVSHSEESEVWHAHNV